MQYSSSLPMLTRVMTSVAMLGLSVMMQYSVFRQCFSKSISSLLSSDNVVFMVLSIIDVAYYASVSPLSFRWPMPMLSVALMMH